VRRRREKMAANFFLLWAMESNGVSRGLFTLHEVK